MFRLKLVKASLNSPSFTGTPLATTANSGTNTTQIATTAFVQTAINNLVDGAPIALNTLNELAAAIDDNSSYASSITTLLNNKAEKINPIFTGTGAITLPTGLLSERPTPSQGMMRYNTTDNIFEGYNGTEWGAIGGSSGSTHYKKGPVIEVLTSVCDGSTVSVPSGTYTFQNVTTSQNCTTSYQTINGSLMNYKPPAGTSRVIYEYIYHTDTEGIDSELVHHKLFIDNVEVINARSNSSNYGHNFGNRRSIEWIFQCNAISNDTNKGYFTSWDALKKLK